MHMDIHNTNGRLPRRSRGFSMVELMVALVITLILMAGVSQVFLSSKQSYMIQDTLGRMQENGRYAMEVLTTDLRRAGYWGGNADINAIDDNTPAGVNNGNKIATDDGTCTNTNWARMLTLRIFGRDDNRTNYGCLPSDTTHIGDILVVRYAAPWVVGGITTPNFDDNQFYIRSSLFEGSLFRGQDQAANPVTGAAVRTAELVSNGYFIHTSTNSDPNKCTGCLQCELACSYDNEGAFNVAKSRIQVFKFHDEGRAVPYTCTQCAEAWCLHACPVEAIKIDAATGAKVVFESTCVGCKVCTIACPFGTINYAGHSGKVVKCDLCGGDPACAHACPTGAITYQDADQTGLDRMRRWAGESLSSATAQ